MDGDEEVSIYELGASVLRHRWSIVRWMIAGAVVAGVVALFIKLSYTSTASFMPQTSENAGRSGLASLAGQLGISISEGAAPANSPDLYVDLLKSRVVLAPIVTDTFTVPEAHVARATLMDLMKIDSTPPEQRVDRAVAKLRTIEQTTINVKTAVVQLSVTSDWPSLSFAINQRLIAAVNAFNLRTRQSQASEERKFTEGRLADARATLRGAEDRLQSFVQSNRQISGSPELKLQQDRLEREVGLDQQIVTSLAQAYEEVRIREVRNTPVVTVIEQPTLPTIPDPRRRPLKLLIGLILGGIIGSVVAMIRDVSNRRRAAGDPEAETFFRVLGDAKGDAARLVPGWRKRKVQ